MHDFLKTLGLEGSLSGVYAGAWLDNPGGPELTSTSPGSGQVIGSVLQADAASYQKVIASSQACFARWRTLPAPQRGDVVRRIGDVLRTYKTELGALVSLEMGKIRAEGEGEVQEMIDMADLAVGMSRQLYGKAMHSERPEHRMFEQWHPLGPVGVITAFNFPVAVWAWNAFVAAVCGDTVIWKPSDKTPLCAVAVQKLIEPICREAGYPGLFNLLTAPLELSIKLSHDERLPLISATGSCRMGREVAKACAGRMARSLLELGGNNALIVLDDADLELALRGTLFGAVGTAGQRCTTTRRLLMTSGVCEELSGKLLAAYKQVSIGDPLESGTLMGPLIDTQAVAGMQRALEEIRAQGGEVLYGGEVLEHASGCFVRPCLVKAPKDLPMMKEETFAPILYLVEVADLADAIAVNNGVRQGLSSAIFTRDLQKAEAFLTAAGSDCGIANVNIGTSGAEIGGAFGGEKDTGGGREAGSDAWKAYMRRQTCTINYGKQLPLAQGIEFGS